MIIVSGTKRSGTSMWMQILIAAGFEPFGDAFPRNWDKTLKAANPDGFYESILRRGIYWQTNPHPVTGHYFFPEQVADHVVKVFIPGLVRTDRAFIGHVIATVRPWREYEASLNRLYALERTGTHTQSKSAVTPPRMPPALEWWYENYSLIRDIVTRRYPVHVQSYDGLLRDPAGTIADTLAWIGRGDAKAGLEAVRPQHRTQHAPESSSLDPRLADTFDTLYAHIDERRPMTTAFIAHLNETNATLAPRIADAQRALFEHQRRQRRAGRGHSAPGRAAP